MGLGGGGSAGSGRQGSVSSEAATQDPPHSHTQNPGSQGSVPPLHHQAQAGRNLPTQGVLSTDRFTHFIMRSSCGQAPCSQQHRDLPPEAHSLAGADTDHGKEIGKCTLPSEGQPLGPGACGLQTFGAEYGVSVTRGRQRTRWLDGPEFEQTPGDSEGQGSLRAAVHGVAKSQTRLSNRTTCSPLGPSVPGGSDFWAVVKTIQPLRRNSSSDRGGGPLDGARPSRAVGQGTSLKPPVWMGGVSPGTAWPPGDPKHH